VALVGSQVGCLSYALFFGFFYGLSFGCGSFWVVWVGYSLGFRVCFLGFGLVPRYSFLSTWRRFALFDIYNVTYKKI
jgi:hypothetical protein